MTEPDMDTLDVIDTPPPRQRRITMDRPGISLVARIAMLLVLLLPWLAHAELTAEVDAREITIEQSLRLVLTSTLPNNSEQPDFSELARDFDVLGRSEQTNLQTIGQKMTQTRSWHLELAPKRKGVATIPGFSVGGETTEPIQITVAPPKIRRPGEDQGDYYMESSVDKDSAYVQSQIIYTLRVFSIQNFLDGSLSEVKADGVQVQELGDSRSYREVINGKNYQVLEKKFALFPQRSGEIVIPPMLLNASVPKKGARNRGIFTPSQTIRRKSAAISVSVLPRPDSSGSDWWLPAAHVRLASQWEGDSVALQVGDSVTRNVALLADGVNSTQLPELPVPSNRHFKVYASQPQLDDQAAKSGLTAVRQEKWAVVATHPGTFTLPEIRVPWFNTETGQPEVAILPAETLTIIPAENTDPGSNPLVTDRSPSADNQGSGARGSEIGESGTGVQAGKTEAELPMAALSARLAAATDSARRWKWAALVLACGWLLGALVALWYLCRRYWSKSKQAAPASRSRPPSIAAVREACESGDARSSADALLEWAGACWPDNPPLTLVALASRFDSSELRTELARLDSLLYAGPAADPSTGGSGASKPGEDSVQTVLASIGRHLARAVEQFSNPVDNKRDSALPGL